MDRWFVAADTIGGALWIGLWTRGLAFSSDFSNRWGNPHRAIKEYLRLAAQESVIRP